MDLPLQTWVEKTAHGKKKDWISSKEKVRRAKVSKEGDADSLLGHWKTHYYLFP